MKKLLLHFFMFNAFLFSFFVQAMEVTQAKKGAEIDWARKKRDMASCCCWVEKNDKKYPYFLDKDDGNSKSSLVTDEKIIQKYNNFFDGKYDIVSLNNEQKSTLWYVLQTVQQNKELRVEGRDKIFAQKMSQRIEKLSLEIKQKISKKYGRDMLCNTNYNPSYWDVLLDDEWNKNDCAHITSEWGMCACHTASLYCALSGMTRFKGLCLCCSVMTILYCQHWVYSVATNWLRETSEKKDQRHGFVAVSLLKEMESQIVDATKKEKID